MAFALAVFGVAAIFCIALVNVSLSTAGNAIDQAADEQDFLAASSAAKLLQDIIPGKEITFTGLSNDSGGGSGTGAAPGSTPGSTDPDQSDDGPSFTIASDAGSASPILRAMGDALLSDADADGKRASKEVKLAVGSGSGGGSSGSSPIPDVTVKLIPSTNKNSFDMTAVARSEKGNTVTLTLIAEVEEESDKTTVSWEVGTISK